MNELFNLICSLGFNASKTANGFRVYFKDETYLSVAKDNFSYTDHGTYETWRVGRRNDVDGYQTTDDVIDAANVMLSQSQRRS